ncbi:MAG: ester cyclase [Thermoleophilaceae bacterium]
MAETKTDGAEAPEAAAEAKPQRRRITRRKAVEAHARSYFDAIANRDTSAMAGHWTEDGVDDLVPLGPLRGRGEITAFFSELFAAVPDLETTVTRVVAGERQAAVEWRMTGHFTGGPFQGVDATGRRVDMRGLDLLEIEDGSIVANTAYYDGMTFARQIGLMPARDSSAELAMKNAFNATTRVRRAVADWRSSR